MLFHQLAFSDQFFPLVHLIEVKAPKLRRIKVARHGGLTGEQLLDLGLHRQLSLPRPELPATCTSAPQRARLGAYLESDASGVWVRQVAPGSAAETGGLRPGDRILELNGRPVQRAGQVIRGVRLQPDGQPLQLTIERAGRRLLLNLKLAPSSEPVIASRDNGGASGRVLRQLRRDLA